MINNLLSSYLWHGYNFKEYDDKDYLMWLLSEIENNGGDEGQNDNPYAKNYLTFEALEDTTFSFARNALQYSLNGGTTWETLEANTASPTVTSGSTIMWRQTGLIPDENGIGRFSSTGEYKAYGNVMSLYYGNDFENKTDLTEKDYAFCELFSGYVVEDDEYIETYLIDASNLVLPATTLATACYAGMFDGCTLLTTAPELPSTTLTTSCYGGMFNGCTSLTTAPVLPATTLAEACYDSMFDGCTSLTTAPSLPATTLAVGCYQSMFRDCTSLTIAPTLPATTLAQSCYAGMFANCTSLTTAPVLSATTLAEACCDSMFSDCTSLITAPDLPATILTNECYTSMFSNCTSLTTAPVLSATTLAEACCDSMFNGCTSLTTAPVLSATTLANNCYNYMFNGCSSLSYVDIHANEEINYLVYDNANSAYGQLVLHGDTPLVSQDSFLQQFIGWELWIDDTLSGLIEGSGGEYYDNGAVE